MSISPDESIRIIKMVPSLHELRIIDLMRDYRAIKRRSFGDSIPDVEDVAFLLASKAELKRIIGSEDGSGFSCSGFIAPKSISPFIIGIDASLLPSFRRVTLLHEMAHLKVNIQHGRNMGHGKLWIREMHRLVRIGEFDAWF